MQYQTQVESPQPYVLPCYAQMLPKRKEIAMKNSVFL